jgi:hypothetical protein
MSFPAIEICSGVQIHLSRVPDAASVQPEQASAKEQTFSHCVRKGNITQELRQGNASRRTS